MTQRSDWAEWDATTRSFDASASAVPAGATFRLAADQQFGSFTIVRPLGAGGMGEVYEAEERESGRRVALKVLSRSAASSALGARFAREGQLAAGISHPNTIYVYGTEEIHGVPVIAMELAAGGTLKDLVSQRGVPPWRQAVDIILQVIAGLEAAADAGVLHRDIKPRHQAVELFYRRRRDRQDRRFWPVGFHIANRRSHRERAGARSIWYTGVCIPGTDQR